nr:hypothetical protein [Tanacetum cinerariifolium]
MASLADKAILSGADNRPPMLEKDMYDSWKSRMELYMLKRPHGRMILESVEQGPLIWPSVEVEGVTRLKKYSELSAAEAIQADCDVKVTNIILQGLPPEVYALVSTHKIAKELWERIQMLIQGTSLTKQERECKLAVSFKVSLSSALIATVALLIIVVVAVVVVGVVVIATVVIVVIVGICRSASTVSGQMANSFAIIAPRSTLKLSFVLNSITDPLVHQFSGKFNCLLHCFWLGCLHAIMNRVGYSTDVLLNCADNHPSMLEKDLYDLWKSRMELYMLNRPHGRMILELVEQGPLIWPSVKVEGVTRLKKYSKLSAAEAI